MKELDEEQRCPRRDRREEGEIQNAEPGGGETIEDADGLIKVAVSQERCGDERDGEQEKRDAQGGWRDCIVAREEVEEGRVNKAVKGK